MCEGGVWSDVCVCVLACVHLWLWVWVQCTFPISVDSLFTVYSVEHVHSG